MELPTMVDSLGAVEDSNGLLSEAISFAWSTTSDSGTSEPARSLETAIRKYLRPEKSNRCTFSGSS